MKKILVIEDDVAVRSSLVELLILEDFEVHQAEDGVIGVGMAQKYLPDLIICDVMMPELDGYGVLTQLHQIPATSNIPFIFLTAKADFTDLRQGMNLGADDYLTKPFTRVTLLEAIRARLDRHTIINQQFQKKLGDLRANLARALPHEFNTPLSIINLSSELLTTTDVPLEHEQVVKLGQKIQAGVGRLTTLAHKFLTYTELELAGTDPTKLQMLRSCRIESSRELISEVARQKARHYKREADLRLELLESPIQIAPTSLEKLLEELIDNAFKYSVAGTEVRLVTIIKEKAFVLYITDNGRGMAPEYIANIGAYMQFERKHFEQQGTGLGLAIAKQIAELHSGELNIESIPGQKTMVRVTLPR